jgi:hypothetical protein
MVKRIVLAVSFVVALGVAGLTTSAASAHGYGCGSGGYGGYYSAGYPAYGYYDDYYAPRRIPVYGGHLHRHRDHYHLHRDYYRGYNRGITVGFGF